MKSRSQQSSVVFLHPFRLSDTAELHPAGIYRIITEQEELCGISFIAYRTVAAFLQLPALGKWGVHTRHLPINLDELATSLAADRASVTLRLVCSDS
jgi:hypothetical protein